MIQSIFERAEIIKKVQNKLPLLFQISEIDSSRAGRIGMEVGSLRERILIALLVNEIGADNVETEIPITEPEIDVIVSENPISIKTITGKRILGFKVIWTVDRENALEFVEGYTPTCDILLAHINWDSEGALYFIPTQVQLNVFKQLGRDDYLKLPKPGTNPRGVELSTYAARNLAQDERTLRITIQWLKQEIEYNPYKRWLDYWKEE